MGWESEFEAGAEVEGTVGSEFEAGSAVKGRRDGRWSRSWVVEVGEIDEDDDELVEERGWSCRAAGRCGC